MPLDDLLKDLLGQMGAVGVLIGFLYHLYHRLETQMQKREQQMTLERAQMVELYEAKIKSIVKSYREDAQAHQKDRDDWFAKYLGITEKLSEILHAHTRAMTKQNALLAGCPHNKHELSQMD